MNNTLNKNNDFTCIAVDMGASSIRVMLGAIKRDGLSYKEIHRIPNEIVEMDGHERWDMDRIWNGIREGISKALEMSDSAPSSIGVDSWGVDFVLLDEEGERLEHPVAYRDKRTEGMQELWETLMPGVETFRRTGINFYIFNTLFQFFSLKDSEVMQRVSKILFIPAYINYLLSGSARNELTISSTSQVLGVKGDQWDPEILQKLHMEEALLGEVTPPGARLGSVTWPQPDGSQMENVAVCGHDTACVVAAIPVDNPNFAYISAGTWCIVGIETDTPLISEDALKLGITNERGYNNSYRSLKNIVGLWLVQGLKSQLPEETSYSDIEVMVGEGEPVMQVIDPDDPLFYNPEDMRMAFDTYFGKTGQQKPEEFTGYLSCAYDSLCFSFRYHIERLEKLSGKSIEVLHLVGGGSQSEILNQRIATICGRAVISGPVEGATLGNILIQAIAMGRISSLEEGRKLLKQSCTTSTYHPEPAREQLEMRYERFVNLKET
ncbi:MAG: rhamnulokinase family protein [Bacteroidota bacterium]